MNNRQNNYQMTRLINLERKLQNKQLNKIDKLERNVKEQLIKCDAAETIENLHKCNYLLEKENSSSKIEYNNCLQKAKSFGELKKCIQDAHDTIGKLEKLINNSDVCNINDCDDFNITNPKILKCLETTKTITEVLTCMNPRKNHSKGSSKSNSNNSNNSNNSIFSNITCSDKSLLNNIINLKEKIKKIKKKKIKIKKETVVIPFTSSSKKQIIPN